MNWKFVGIGACVAIGALYALGQYNSPFAKDCVLKEEDRNWSFLSFYNNCEYPINVIFCDKMAVGELGKLLGYNTGEFNCRTHHATPGNMFTTIKWTNEQSSVASIALSSSEYRFAACKIPFRPIFKEGGKYACEK